MGYKIILEHGPLETFWMHCLGLWTYGAWARGILPPS